MKILKHKSTGKVRLLMRREKVQKVACNHYITSDLKLNAMDKTDGKAWIWYAVDFADEKKEEPFAIRYRHCTGHCIIADKAKVSPDSYIDSCYLTQV